MSSPELELPTVPVSELNATFGVLLIGFIFAVTLYGLTFFRRPYLAISETRPSTQGGRYSDYNIACGIRESTSLCGTATSQIYNYWQNFPYDYKLHRWTVGVLYSCSITQNFTLSAFWSLAVMLAGIVQRFKPKFIRTMAVSTFDEFGFTGVGLLAHIATVMFMQVPEHLPEKMYLNYTIFDKIPVQSLKTPRRAHEEPAHFILEHKAPSDPQHIANIYQLTVYTHVAYPGIRWSDPSSSKMLTHTCQNVRKFKLQSRKQEI
ncbi:predicted protein [Postia placenta Mad-698-R]|nr:predicted protein [Postia placenta Mad-698-R]